VLSDALDAADLVDPRQGEERLEDRDSSRTSAKDRCEVAERDPEEEEEHRQRSRRDKCLLDFSSALSAKRSTKEECGDSTAVERWDRQQIQDCKIRREEGGNLKEPTESEPLSRSGNTNSNPNRPRECWAFFGTAKWCTKEIGESADDCPPRFNGSLCSEANHIGHWSFKWARWEKVSDTDPEYSLTSRLLNGAQPKRDLTRDVGAAQNRKLHIGPRRFAQSYERGFEAVKRNAVE
jgi:hypothetical protein